MELALETAVKNLLLTGRSRSGKREDMASVALRVYNVGLGAELPVGSRAEVRRSLP